MEDHMNNAEKIRREAARFPETFGLRSFPGGLFTINESASYVDSDGVVQLYVYTDRGKAFAKATVEELAALVVGPVASFFGTWPGDETDEELQRLAQEVDD
jgi:hypothetical protein